MKRRTFLQTTGLLTGGATVTWTDRGDSASAESGTDPKRTPEASFPSRVLITSAEHNLACAIASRLAKRCRIRLTGGTKPSDVPAAWEFVPSDLDASESTRALVRGVEAIVHVAEAPDEATTAERIECRARLTYNLLKAAVAEGVHRVVYLSTLRMMTRYDEQFEVTENWQPLPADERTGLSHYLGEVTCREFAREGQLELVVLRLGDELDAGSGASRPVGPLSVDRRDVIEAVALSLEAKLDTWTVLHIQSDVPSARFTTAKAERVLGFKPRVCR